MVFKNIWSVFENDTILSDEILGWPGGDALTIHNLFVPTQDPGAAHMCTQFTNFLNNGLRKFKIEFHVDRAAR